MSTPQSGPQTPSETTQTGAFLQVAMKVLESALNTQSSVSWQKLRYLIGEVTYGGRVTDTWDSQCLNALLYKFCNPEVLREDVSFCSDEVGEHADPQHSVSQMGVRYLKSAFKHFRVHFSRLLLAVTLSTDISSAQMYSQGQRRPGSETVPLLVREAGQTVSVRSGRGDSGPTDHRDHVQDAVGVFLTRIVLSVIITGQVLGGPFPPHWLWL